MARGRAPVNGGNTEHSVSVRKIDNGYISRQSTFNSDTGEYSSNETFSRGKPAVQMTVQGGNDQDGSDSGKQALQAAMLIAGSGRDRGR